ncbi:FemAB family XrtA/PEP-CTERM system-associated protein [Fundidesulfovibrio terrae]|uniref:FemAB family XrtA/PEP-CTERM system-associated protein n=1 Tax=Fundidesulfovibrio terrae TaxID=2922866 RepID=UPI001FAFF48B|nr:FemAB family XrtA/PEP-CTERM system-associated protein [Fundidesulfovibrio terrae]
MTPGTMAVRTVDPGNPEEASRWDAFVESMESASFYHKMDWLRVIRDSFSHDVHPLATTDGDGRILGILPLVHIRSRIFSNALISLPFLNYGGVLATTPAAAATLNEEARGLMKKLGCSFVELRHVKGHGLGDRTRSHKVTMTVPLSTDTAALWKSVASNARTKIRKAQKSGLTVSSGREELLDGFYDVFARNMRDLGTPVYSKGFFHNILRAFPENTRVFTVAHEGKPVASGLAVWFRGFFEVPWASSLKEWRVSCPNYLLSWETMRHAAENGFTEFDFGRSTPGSGPYAYKKQWGTKEIPLNWEYCLDGAGGIPEHNPQNSRYALAIRIWQCLPMPVTRLIGPHIVRNIP